ncbi:MAG: histidine kinase [Clostridia bacterium]|nr:histidine kinase [Clostridia bacterium]
MDRIKSLFRNILIRYKIIIIYIPLIIIPLLILGWISNYIFTEEIIKKTFINVQDDSSLILTRINGLIANTESCANIIVKDMNGKNIKSLFEVQDNNEAFAFEKRREILYVLNYALVIFPEVESAAFIDSHNDIYYTSKNSKSSLEPAIDSEIIKKINASNGVNLWFPMQRSDYLVDDKNEAVLMLGKKVLDIDRGNMLGALILNINESSISSIYDKLGTSKGGNYFIADEAGKVVSSKNKEELFKAKAQELTRVILGSSSSLQKTVYVDGKETLITKTPIEKMNWTLVNQTDLIQLTSEIKKLSVITFWIGLTCLAIALFGGSMLSNLIAKPIVKLTRKMQKVKEGSLDIQYDVDSTDEIGLLASGFNSMLERIRSLLDKIKEEQKKKREYELALIQAQIKPHFLYNTLDLIYIFCSMGRNKEAQSTTKNLADFYRIALSKGKEIITIEEELKNVENYLSIQRVRYSDIFDYEIKGEETVLGFDIPKLTIQPLVENSIYHGLKLKGSFGRLLIESYIEGEDVVIKIIDDGIGIPEEKLKTVLEHDQAERQSFGLTSVNERIKLYFGDEYGLKMESIVGQGTTAVIRIPKQKEGRQTSV